MRTTPACRGSPGRKPVHGLAGFVPQAFRRPRPRIREPPDFRRWFPQSGPRGSVPDRGSRRSGLHQPGLHQSGSPCPPPGSCRKRVHLPGSQRRAFRSRQAVRRRQPRPRPLVQPGRRVPECRPGEERRGAGRSQPGKNQFERSPSGRGRAGTNQSGGNRFRRNRFGKHASGIRAPAPHAGERRQGAQPAPGCFRRVRSRAGSASGPPFPPGQPGRLPQTTARGLRRPDPMPETPMPETFRNPLPGPVPLPSAGRRLRPPC